MDGGQIEEEINVNYRKRVMMRSWFGPDGRKLIERDPIHNARRQQAAVGVYKEMMKKESYSEDNRSLPFGIAGKEDADVTQLLGGASVAEASADGETGGKRSGSEGGRHSMMLMPKIRQIPTLL